MRAATAILEEDGPDALTVQSIVARAGSSVGSFYARFAGKDELLEYLGGRVWREAAERWDAALADADWSPLDLGARVEGAVRLLAEAGFRAPFLRALDRVPGPRDDAFAAFQAHVLNGLEELLLERADEILHPDPPLAVRLGLRAALSVLEDAGAESPGSPPSERRRAEATLLLIGYLRPGPSGGEQPPTGEDFFDIWG